MDAGGFSDIHWCLMKELDVMDCSRQGLVDSLTALYITHVTTRTALE